MDIGIEDIKTLPKGGGGSARGGTGGLGGTKERCTVLKIEKLGNWKFAKMETGEYKMEAQVRLLILQTY